MRRDLKTVFEGYAAFGRSGQSKDTMTGNNFTKMMKENKLIDKKLSTTEIDMIFARAKGGAGNKVLTYSQFQHALGMCAKSKYGSDSEENIQKIKCIICSGEGPFTAGTTVASKTGGMEKMTDSSKYTGSHKERFDESGKGKGLQGRKDKADSSGYVSGYKEEGSYDKKH